MRPRTAHLPALAAIALILGSGYVHGLWSFRWSATAETRAAAEKLAKVPKAFGDWTGTEAPIDDRQLEMARIDGSVSRRYVNARTGESVMVLLVCGRPGPISAHTPEVCYGGTGYAVDGERTKVAVDYGASAPAEFWAIRMKKSDPTQTQGLVIDYGWNANGEWTAPAVDARLQFAGHPVLYKLYVVRERGRGEERLESDPNVDFLKDFLPRLRPILGADA